MHIRDRVTDRARQTVQLRPRAEVPRRGPKVSRSHGVSARYGLVPMTVCAAIGNATAPVSSTYASRAASAS